MAKTTKSEKSERQKVIDDIRRKQKGAERRQGFVILAVCIVAAVVIVGLAAFNPIRTWLEQKQHDDKALDEIGAPASVCGDVITKDATGQQDHRDGQQITYEHAPPAFGPHWPSPDTIEDRFYSKDTRPELEVIVHNLEHGYTVLWYDETAADDASTLGEIKAIADKLNDSDTNNRLSFKAVPWTEEDGKEFPDGMHVALTHWTADQQTSKSAGVWQYCSEPSGAAVEQFMEDYPYYNAPEPIGGYMGPQ